MIDAMVQFIFNQCLGNPNFKNEKACHEAYVNCLVNPDSEVTDTDYTYCVRVLERDKFRKVYDNDSRSDAGGSNE